MAYGKSEFLHWNEDIDLHEVLGDFTQSECEAVLSDEDAPFRRQQAFKKSKGEAQYKCKECNSLYTSVTGIRGHMQNKHGLTRIRASTYRLRKEKTTEVESKQSAAFRISEAEVSSVFKDVLDRALDEIINCEFKNMEVSVGGTGIVRVAIIVNTTETLKEKVSAEIRPMFVTILTEFHHSQNPKEELFASFYQRMDSVRAPLVQLVRDSVSADLPVKQFCSVLLYRVLEELIKQRSSLINTKSASSAKISEKEQQVLYYISGYIIRATKRACEAQRKCGNHELSEALNNMICNESDLQKTISETHSGWTEKLNRGGLTIPSDTFFSLIIEFESVCRSNSHEKMLIESKHQLTKTKEAILENSVVKHHTESLNLGKYEHLILEKIVSLFLTIRGNAVAKVTKTLKENNYDGSKSVRQCLKEISGNSTSK